MEDNATKEGEESKSTADAGEGDKPEATGILGEVSKEREELAKEREAAQKAISELRELKAIQILGGGSPAGAPPVEKKEETPAEYAARISRGELRDGEGT